MSDVTAVAGIQVPSRNPLFLAVVGVHIVLGLACVSSGAVAMLSVKAPGRHPAAGRIYCWSLAAIFVTATALSIAHWTQDKHLFLLGLLAFVAAYVGRSARRHQWAGWPRWHVVGMGSSYVLLLTAFYVDNGNQLPLWKDLPAWTYWSLPALVGAPVIVWALCRHPVVTHGFRRGR
jgi:hypothetical protein